MEKVDLQRGDEPFAGAAMDAVRTWEFKPALRDGKPVASLAVLPVRFQLKPTQWILLAIPADGVVASDPPEYQSFDTEAECERAALEAKDLIAFGCLYQIEAASTVVARRNADQPPAGWSELILAPIGAEMTPTTNAPDGDWFRIGTFPNQTFCETSRLTLLELNKKQPAHLAVRQLDAGLLCLAPH